MNFDSRFLMWLAGLIFIAGGMVYTLSSVAADVEKLADVVTEHVTSDGHRARGVRVDYIEERQKGIADTVDRLDTRQQTMMTNQAAICTKLGVSDCK